MRTYTRKSVRGRTSLENIQNAVADMRDGTSLCKSDAQLGVNYRTLLRYVKVYEKHGNIATVGYKWVRQIFPENMEADLADYAKRAARRYYGLGPKDMRIIAYQYALANL